MKQLRRILVFVLATLVGLSPASAREPGLDDPVLLAAAPELSGPFARAVLFAIPTANGGHVGFILNRPTTLHVSAVFPEIPAAKEVPSPVFLGGPQLSQTLVALTRSPHAPTENAVLVMADLFMTFGEDVARTAERFPQRTRFFAGLVAWENGELQAELAAGAWQALEPDIELVIGGSADTLWERLRERSRSMVALR